MPNFSLEEIKKMQSDIASLKEKLENSSDPEERNEIEKQLESIKAKLNDKPEEEPEEEKPQKLKPVLSEEEKLKNTQEISQIQDLIAQSFVSGDIYAMNEKNEKFVNFRLTKSEEGPKNFRSIAMRPKKSREENISGKILAIIARFKNLGFLVKEDLKEESEVSFCGVLFPSSYGGNKNILTMSEAQIQEALEHLQKEPSTELKKQAKHNIFCFSFRTVPEFEAKKNFDLNQSARIGLENWQKELNQEAKEPKEAKPLKENSMEVEA